MLLALSLMLVGAAPIVAAYVLPMISDHVPLRLKIALLFGGLALILGGAMLGLEA